MLMLCFRVAAELEPMQLLKISDRCEKYFSLLEIFLNSRFGVRRRSAAGDAAVG